MKTEARTSGQSRTRGMAKPMLLVILSTVAMCLWAADQKAMRADSMSTLRFKVHLNSLEPSAISVPEGRYLIQVNSAILRGEVPFHLDDPLKASLASTKVSARLARRSVVVDLKAGLHTLTIAGKAKWVSKITVIKREK